MTTQPNQTVPFLEFAGLITGTLFALPHVGRAGGEARGIDSARHSRNVERLPCRPIVLATPPQLSQTWFGASERTTATSVALAANTFGPTLGFLFSLFVTDTAGVVWLLRAEVIACCCK